MAPPVEIIIGLPKLATHSISCLLLISAEAILKSGIPISLSKKIALLTSKGWKRKLDQDHLHIVLILNVDSY